MLYKYLSDERVDVLKNLKIRFSPFSSLNDPFEACPLIDMSKKVAEYEADIDCEIHTLFSKTESTSTIEKAKNEVLSSFIEKTSPNTVGQEFMSVHNDKLGILSLSRTEHSLLMWSHYANEGKGFVLALDDEHEFFKLPDMYGNITEPISVNYSSKRIKVIPTEEEKLYQKMFGEKPLEWAYEEEVRLFRTLSHGENTGNKDKYDNGIALFDLPADMIKAVYFGYRVSQGTKNKIHNAIKTNSIECNVFESSICPKEYKIVFDEVKL